LLKVTQVFFPQSLNISLQLARELFTLRAALCVHESALARRSFPRVITRERSARVESMGIDHAPRKMFARDCSWSLERARAERREFMPCR